MKKIIIISTVFLASLQTAFCQMGALKGSGKVVTKSFSFNKFSTINLLDLDGKVKITVGKAFKITADIDDNLADLLAVSELNNNLTIALKGNLNNRLYVENSKINININLLYLNVNIC